VFLVLGTDRLMTLRTDKSWQIGKQGKVTSYNYMQIESIKKEESKEHSFTFTLNFYNKDLDKKKVKHIRFECLSNHAACDEEKPREKQSWLHLVGVPEQPKHSALEFNVTYSIERQINLEWQRTLESHIGLQPGVSVKGCQYDPEDCYQMHGYVKKKNRWLFYDNRFIVLTLKWMINADAGFVDAPCKDFQFKKFLWRAPLAALRSVDLIQDGDLLTVKMKFDVNMTTRILADAGYKTDKTAKIKEKRKLLFSDMLTAQNFVF
jgi:hypothetical protein